MLETNENEAKKTTMTYTKVTDGRSFVIRVFLPVTSAETMQNKIEQVLHRDIANAIRQSVV